MLRHARLHTRTIYSAGAAPQASPLRPRQHSPEEESYLRVQPLIDATREIYNHLNGDKSIMETKGRTVLWKWTQVWAMSTLAVTCHVFLDMCIKVMWPFLRGHNWLPFSYIFDHLRPRDDDSDSDNNK